MQERYQMPSSPDREKFVKVYSGTFRENLNNCLVMENGVIYYDKNKISDVSHNREGLYFTTNLEYAADYAFRNSIRDLGRLPIILEGIVPERLAPRIHELIEPVNENHSSEKLRLTTIWILKDEFYNYSTKRRLLDTGDLIRLIINRDRTHLSVYFRRLSQKEFLEFVKHVSAE